MVARPQSLSAQPAEQECIRLWAKHKLALLIFLKSFSAYRIPPDLSGGIHVLFQRIISQILFLKRDLSNALTVTLLEAKYKRVTIKLQRGGLPRFTPVLTGSSLWPYLFRDAMVGTPACAGHSASGCLDFPDSLALCDGAPRFVLWTCVFYHDIE